MRAENFFILRRKPVEVCDPCVGNTQNSTTESTVSGLGLFLKLGLLTPQAVGHPQPELRSGLHFGWSKSKGNQLRRMGLSQLWKRQKKMRRIAHLPRAYSVWQKGRVSQNSKFCHQLSQSLKATVDMGSVVAWLYSSACYRFSACSTPAGQWVSDCHVEQQTPLSDTLVVGQAHPHPELKISPLARSNLQGHQE